MKNYYYVLFVFFILIMSCKKNNLITKHKFKNNITIKDSIKIPISNDEYYISLNSFVKNELGTDYVYRVDYRNSMLNVYDWKLRKKVKKIIYKNSGLNRISSFNGSVMYPFNLDSILIATVNGKIYFTKNDSILYSKKHEFEGFIPQFQGIFSKPFKHNDKLFMFTAAPYSINDKRYFERPLIFTYNIKNETVESFPVKYPNYFKNFNWSREHLRVPFVRNENGDMVVTFCNSDSIFVYNLDSKKVINRTNAKSIYIDDIKPFSGDYNNREKYNYYVEHQARYLTILFDKYKNRYYRINILPSETKVTKRGYFKDVPFSIMVLDNNFNILAERKFKKNKYSVIDHFITNEGLWISNNNSLNNSFDENVLSFTLLTLDID